MISRPECDLVSTGVECAGLTLVLSSLDFSFGTAFLLLLAGGDFATGSGVSAKGFAEGAGSGTSGVADGGTGAICAGSSFARLAGYLTDVHG